MPGVLTMDSVRPQVKPILLLLVALASPLRMPCIQAKANDDDAVAPNAQPKETGTGEMERPAEAKPPAPEDDTAEDNGGKAVQRKESTRRKTKIKREE